jgi:hypothetical protein
MDEETGSALQQLADTKLDGRLRERVEAHRRKGDGWREIAVALSEETRLGIAKSTLHRWAEEGGWDVNPAGADRAAS